MKHVFTLLLLFLFFSARSQSVVYVTSNGAGNQSGGSWSDALPGGQLQSRLSSASSGTQFWVARGSYSPGILRTATFLIPSGVQVYGGFVGNESQLANRFLTQPSSTTFTGEVGDPNTVSDNNYHIVTFKNVSSNTRLDGVIITGGNADQYNTEDGNGGGVYNSSSQSGIVSSPTIANCLFVNNNASNYGGGMHNYAISGSTSNPILLNCTFINNTAEEGGGLRNSVACATANPTILNCLFDNNVATRFGGGAVSSTAGAGGCGPVSANIVVKKTLFKNNRANYAGAISIGGFDGVASPDLADCQFLNNTAVYSGGAVSTGVFYDGQCLPLFRDCLFEGNTASSGGAVHNDGNNSRCDPTYLNCTFFNNQATKFGGALHNTTESNTFPGSCKSLITNCIFRTNTAPDGSTLKDEGPNTQTTITYSNIQGGFAGTGNIDADPQFVDATNGNYRLLRNSPSVNTGDPNSTTANVSATDLAGNPRVVGGRIDMGAYEFAPVADLRLAFAVGNRVPMLNQPVTYSLTVTNDGPEPATNVAWQNRLPPNLLFVGGSTVTSADGAVNGSLALLAPGAAQTFTYQLQPTQPGQYISAAQITASDLPDPDSQPNSGTGDGQDDAATADLRTSGSTNGSVYVSPNPNQVPLPPVLANQPPADPTKADLSLTMAVSNRSPKVGDVITVTLQVNNAGGLTSTSAAVTLILPDGISFVSGNGFGQAGQTITGRFNAITAGTSATLTAQLRVDTSNRVRLSAEISAADQPDPDSTPGNGTTNGEDDTATVDLRTTL